MSRGSRVRVLRRWTAGEYGALEVEYAPGAVMPTHRHGEASATLVLRGEIHERGPGFEGVARACSLCVKPAGVEHSNRVGPDGARTLAFVLPSSAVSAAGYGIFRDAALARAALRLCELVPSGEGLGEAVEALVRVAGESPMKRGGGCGVDHWVDRALAMAEDDGVESCSRIAESLGVHPASLSRAIRREFGESLKVLMRRRRVLCAAEGLGRCETALRDVAALAGFSDQSHLTREFRRELGVTPGRYRALAVSV